MQRVPTGWIDEAEGKLKLKGISAAAGGIVTVTKPELEYFLRGGRKRAPTKLPVVFEAELVKVITPPVAWQPKGGPPDVVCLSCFTALKSMEHGTERLVDHCRRAIVISARPVSGQAEKAEPAARGRQRRQSPPEGPGQRGKGRNGAATTPGKRGRGRARAASGQEEQRIPGQSKTPGQAELHV